MKFNSFVMRVILIASIVLSIILSWKIWTNNTHYERRTDSQTTTKAVSRKSDRKISDIFLPTQILWRTNQQSQLVYNSKESLVPKLKEAMKLTKSARFKASKLSEANYYQAITTDDTLTLLYPDNISYAVFKKVFDDSNNQLSRNTTFNRIKITMGNKPQLTLMNDKSHMTYQTTMRQFSEAQVKRILDHSDVHLNVKESLLNHKPFIYVAADQSLLPYSYLVNQQPENYYITTLLDQKNTDNIDAKEQGDNVIYTDGANNDLYKRLTINHKTGEIAFVKYEDTKSPTGLTKSFETSFAALLKTGNSLSGMRFYSYDEDTNSTTYRTYVEGAPTLVF
ncbi:two-component system activity regulator YycH, partial [Latilactobacillus sakei]